MYSEKPKNIFYKNCVSVRLILIADNREKSQTV